MNCKECSGLLIDYMEDTLSVDESGAVKEHLDSCPDCSIELEHYREIRTAAQEEALPDASPEVLSRLSEAARNSVKKDKPSIWKRWSYSPILVPTISAAIAVSVWFYYGLGGIHNMDEVTSEVSAVKMRASEQQDEALSNKEDEFILGFESREGNALTDTIEQEEQKKPAPESRILPVSPGEKETSQDTPAKADLKGKEVTKEDKVTFRSGNGTGDLSPTEEDMVTNREWSSQQGNAAGIEDSEGELKATQPILRDYAGELGLALRQQSEGNCDASIKTNEALLKSSPPPPLDVQAASYKSLAECYESKGDLEKAIASYNNLGRVDPAQSGYVKEKLEEIKKEQIK